MKYCPNCGTEADSSFCPNCGTAMQERLPRCPNCGTESNSSFCPNCGTAMQWAKPRCPNCGMETDSSFCPNCGTAISGAAGYSASPASPYAGSAAPYAASPYAGSATPYAASPAADPSSYQLGWHKFLIYFALWCAGVLDVLNGAADFKLASDFSRYTAFRSYVSIFQILGVATIAVGIYLIVVRFYLAGFRRNAPTMLLIANIITLAINVTGQLIASFLPTDTSGAEVLASAAGGLVFLIICWRYYANRRALFVN